MVPVSVRFILAAVTLANSDLVMSLTVLEAIKSSQVSEPRSFSQVAEKLLEKPEQVKHEELLRRLLITLPFGKFLKLSWQEAFLQAEGDFLEDNSEILIDQRKKWRVNFGVNDADKSPQIRFFRKHEYFNRQSFEFFFPELKPIFKQQDNFRNFFLLNIETKEKNLIMHLSESRLQYFLEYLAGESKDSIFAAIIDENSTVVGEKGLFAYRIMGNRSESWRWKPKDRRIDKILQGPSVFLDAADFDDNMHKTRVTYDRYREKSKTLDLLELCRTEVESLWELGFYLVRNYGNTDYPTETDSVHADLLHPDGRQGLKRNLTQLTALFDHCVPLRFDRD